MTRCITMTGIQRVEQAATEHDYHAAHHIDVAGDQEITP